MHTKNDNIEIMLGSETVEIIEKPFEFLLQKYQEGLKEKMRGSEFVFSSQQKHCKSLNSIMKQLLLISYMCLIILKEKNMHISQNIILTVKIK